MRRYEKNSKKNKNSCKTSVNTRNRRYKLNTKSDIKLDNIMIAYEPVWAIGTGKIPDTKKLEEILLYIKDKVVLLSGINPILIYGGSVNENTIEKLKHVNLIDGYLIGSASLNINSLETIIEVIK